MCVCVHMYTHTHGCECAYEVRGQLLGVNGGKCLYQLSRFDTYNHTHTYTHIYLILFLLSTLLCWCRSIHAIMHGGHRITLRNWFLPAKASRDQTQSIRLAQQTLSPAEPSQQPLFVLFACLFCSGRWGQELP